MKYLLILSLAAFSSFTLQSVTETNTEVSLSNDAYVEWVSNHGFRFISDFKDAEVTYNASEIIDNDGNALPLDVVGSTFEIIKYDFSTIVAPESNILIKVTDNKAIIIYSKNRQQVLFERYLINKNAKAKK